MKVINRICQVLAAAFGLSAIVLFFLKFATIVSGSNIVDAMGVELAFGSKLEVAGTTYDMAKSADILFCFILAVIGTVLSICTFFVKSKKLKYAAPAFGLAGAIYMLVIALRAEVWFVDTRPLPSVTEITYSPFVLICAIALFAFAIISAAHLLIADYIEVSESKGDKLTIPKRIVRFFRDYKSEVKKIVWPGIRDVLKNTAIVLIICLIIGALIWVFDWGLGKLLELILQVK